MHRAVNTEHASATDAMRQWSCRLCASVSYSTPGTDSILIRFICAQRHHHATKLLASPADTISVVHLCMWASCGFPLPQHAMHSEASLERIRCRPSRASASLCQHHRHNSVEPQPRVEPQASVNSCTGPVLTTPSLACCFLLQLSKPAHSLSSLLRCC